MSPSGGYRLPDYLHSIFLRELDPPDDTPQWKRRAAKALRRVANTLDYWSVKIEWWGDRLWKPKPVARNIMTLGITKEPTSTRRRATYRIPFRLRPPKEGA